ncbi:DUF2863 family protein [Castellaniella daejeonensis]|jgi:hypothetical protein|uniref:DUF2863 family protein n=1 Tax=Castellaniella daejeonensis TaxID=659013 RepID=A0ABN0TIX7_9BURK|nr:DUF2863 family protein [Castellaniella sp.]HET8703991.1 DUF2863 family protein [Castellaniella sp.]
MPPRSRSSSLSRTSQTLISLAEALSRSGSHLEDIYWEGCLGEALDKALGARHGRAVESALDVLLEQRSAAYELLVELAEARSESLMPGPDGQDCDTLLISAPVLAWTRYRLPSGQLNAAQAQALESLLAEAVLNPRARIAMLPSLVRFDRLPQSFQETRAWTQALAMRALGLRREGPVLRDADAPEDLLADVFFLVGAVVVPRGEPVFQWQSPLPAEAPAQDDVSRRWAEGCARILEAAFTGCQLEYLRPEAYYTSTRQADQGIRPLTLKAAATWLQTAAQIPGTDLRAALVACGEQSVEEYRIGFCTRQSNDVIYGCVWPALSREESQPEPDAEGQVDTWDTIAALLRECGIQDIRRLPGLQPMEFCEDCGTPYFPNMLGDMQHPELPEEIDPEPVQFH